MRRLLLIICFATVRHLAAATLETDFSADPAAQGWSVFGDAQLFKWDAVKGQMDVTWDSSQPNSYFYHSLGTVLTTADDVQLSFDLQLSDVVVGLNSAQPFTFEVAVGLLNLREAMAINFLRGTGSQSPDLLEFDYFPDSGFGATISPTIVSSNNQFAVSFSFPLELTTNDLFHVTMSYTASSRVLETVMERNGKPFAPIKNVQLGSTFTDYHLDTVGICSYNDAGADGSILAHGIVDNVKVILPDPPVGNLSGKLVQGTWQVQVTTRQDWTYTLERTTDWINWQNASSAVLGNGGQQIIRDELEEPAAPFAFYRVRADKPQ
jgi:hypothetical protein